MHLSKFSHIEPALFNMPYAITQYGIAQAVGISRAHACIDLKKGMELGLIDRLQAHIRNNANRRWIYHLTPAGLTAAAEISEDLEMGSTNIEILDPVYCLEAADPIIAMAATDIKEAINDLKHGYNIAAITKLSNAIRHIAVVVEKDCSEGSK